MAFLEDIEDAATADKEHIQQMNETNATIMALCKQLAGTNSEQQTLIKELTASIKKTSCINIPFTTDRKKDREEDSDTARRSGYRKNLARTMEKWDTCQKGVTPLKKMWLSALLGKKKHRRWIG